MKRIYLLILVSAATLFLTGCFNKTQTQKNNFASNQQKEEKIDDLSKALGAGKKYICTYKDSNGVNSKIYIDNDKFKTEYSESGNTQYSLFDGIFYYYWQSNNNDKGYKIEHECLDDLAEGQPDESDENKSEEQQDYDDEVDNYKTDDDFDGASEVSCQSVSNVDLTLPANVSFEDQCALLKATKQALEQFENKLDDIFDSNE